MFVSICVCLVMAFVISKRDGGRQKLNIDPHDDLLLALFGLRTQMYIILVYAGLSSLSVLSQWKPVLDEPPVHKVPLEHSGMGSHSAVCIDTEEDPSQRLTINSAAHGTHHF